jgi:hypothetical protein
MTANFLDALNTKVDDIEKPALMPAGTYIWVVNKPHRESTSKDGKWFTIEIPCVPKAPYEPAEDVDLDELAEYGDLRSASNTIRFMLDTTSEGKVELEKFKYNLKRFLVDTLRVEADNDATLKELLAKCVGAEFIAQAAHRHVPERDETYCDVKNWAPLE